MVDERYRGISIPLELINEIDHIIKSKKHGYKTRSEFIKDALRQYLKYYDKD